MAVIAEVIAGAIQGVTSTVTQGMDKANQLYTSRVLGTAESRNKSSLARNLPLMITSVILLVIIGIVLIRKK